MMDQVQASMRPRPFSLGNVPMPADAGAVQRASMRPRPFSLGNQLRKVANLPLKEYASMRPRPFSLGNGSKTPT